jgi:hypothetical protein
MELNKKELLNKVFEELEVGMSIFTNGDGDIDSEESFFGKIAFKTKNEIHVRREDGEDGEGQENTWLIRTSDENPTWVMIFDLTVTKPRLLSVMKAGDLFVRGSRVYVFMQFLANGKVQAKTGFAATGNPVTLSFSEGESLDFLFKHPSLHCYRCASKVYKVIDNDFFCKEHYDETSKFTCPICGRTIREGGQSTISTRRGVQLVCHVCRTEHVEKTKVIHNYSYKPSPIFIIGDSSGKTLSDSIFGGVEQEVECPSNPETLGGELLKRYTKKEQWCYLKHDGSISNGFELVTHPANLKGHYRLPWKELEEFYKAKGIRADDTTSCGLHIHTNKDVMDDDHQIRLAYFVNSQRDNMERVARRSASSWAKFKRANHPINTLHKSSGDKYEALNWMPPETVEFRLFKGTTSATIMLSSLEFVHACVMFTSMLKLDDLKDRDKSWAKFIKYISNEEYKYLLAYFKTRGVV